MPTTIHSPYQEYNICSYVGVSSVKELLTIIVIGFCYLSKIYKCTYKQLLIIVVGVTFPYKCTYKQLLIILSQAFVIYPYK